MDDIIIFTLRNSTLNEDKHSLFRDKTCKKIKIKNTWNLFSHFGSRHFTMENKYLWKLKNANHIYAYPCLTEADICNDKRRGFITALTKDIATLDFDDNFTQKHTIYYVIHNDDVGINIDDHCLSTQEVNDNLFSYNMDLQKKLNNTAFSTYVFQHVGGVLFSIISSFDWGKNGGNPKQFILNQIRKCL